MNRSLNSSEWTLLSFFFIIIASLIFIAKVNTYRAQDAVERLIGADSVSPHDKSPKLKAPRRAKALKEICVKVDGAIVEPVELVMPNGSRICDLKSKVAFTKDADKKFFRRKKLLRDGDRISVPKEKLERN